MKIAVFTSKGSPILESIVKNSKNGFLRSEIRLVITDRRNSSAIDLCEKEKIPFEIIGPKLFHRELVYVSTLLQILRKYEINFLCLAGYRNKIPKDIIEKFPLRIIKSIPVVNPEDFHGQELYGKKLISAALKKDKIGIVIKFVETGFNPNLIITKYEIDNIAIKKLAKENLEEAIGCLAPTLQYFEERLLLDALRMIELGQIKVIDGCVEKIILKSSAR